MDRAWSQVKKAFEARLAPELQGRLQVHVTGYRSGGRGWIVFQGKEIASVQAPGFTRKLLGHSACVDLLDGQTLELGRACGDLPQMPIETALASPNPLLRGLALLDARCGKRTLEKLQQAPDADSFVALMLAVRRVALGLVPPPVNCSRCGEPLALP
jgi:hypothetical protein